MIPDPLHDPLHIASKRSIEIERILSSPALEFSSIANAENSDVILYTTDMNRRLTYMSKSSQKVCGLDFEKWRKQSFVPMFTDHPMNDFYRNFDDSKLLPNQIQILHCEILSDEGEKVQLEVRRSLLLYESEPIGVIGLTRRIQSVIKHEWGALPIQEVFDFSRVSRLSPKEKFVVQQVVDGELNKNIARHCNVTERTIESRRSSSMAKLGVKSLPELVRFWIAYLAHTERHRNSG